MKRLHIQTPCPTNNIVDLTTALPSLQNSAVWKNRAEEVRENEWVLYKKSLAVIDKALDRIRARPFDPITIADLVKLIEVAVDLGRRAAGVPVDVQTTPSIQTPIPPSCVKQTAEGLTFAPLR